MAPRHTQGCGGGGILCDGASLVPNKPRTGVLVSLSHPLLTQASTQLYTFSGFGLTPAYLPGFDPGAGLERFDRLFRAFREKGGGGDLGGLRGGTLEKGGYGLSRPGWEFRVQGLGFRA